MCDCFTVLPDGGDCNDGLLFAKNSDREGAEPQLLNFFPKRDYPAGTKLALTYLVIDQVRHTHAVLLSRPIWLWGAEMGANEHGLVTGNEAIFSKIKANSTPGMIGMDLLRLALERARDVEEAVSAIISLLGLYGQGGNCGYQQPLSYHNAFLIVDTKRACILEAVHRDWVVRPVDNYEAVSNVMTIGSDFSNCSPSLAKDYNSTYMSDSEEPLDFKAKFSTDDPRLYESGETRRARVMHLLSRQAGRLGLKDCWAILRDHGASDTQNKPGGRGICLHDFNGPLGHTTASWVSSLKSDKQVHWVTGTSAPCTGVFKPVIFNTDLAKHGPLASKSIHEQMYLWQRHNLISRTLLSQETTSQIFNSSAYYKERDILEENFLQTVNDCPAPSDEKSAAICNHILNRCWQQAFEFESSWYGKCF